MNFIFFCLPEVKGGTDVPVVVKSAAVGAVVGAAGVGIAHFSMFSTNFSPIPQQW